MIPKYFTTVLRYTGRISYPQYLGFNIMYCLMVLIFYQMFYLLLKKDLDNFLYCITAQFLVMGSHSVAFSISEKISNKNFFLYLLKPKSFVLLEFCKAFIETIYKFLFLGGVFFFTASLLKNIVLYKLIKVFILFFILYLLSSIINNLLYSVIGLLGFWVKNVKYIIYFNMTLGFVLGGLLLPISEYPIIMKYLCYVTPYPWIINNPASFFAFDYISIINTCFFSIFWIAFLYFIFNIIYTRVLQDITTNGT